MSNDSFKALNDAVRGQRYELATSRERPSERCEKCEHHKHTVMCGFGVGQGDEWQSCGCFHGVSTEPEKCDNRLCKKSDDRLNCIYDYACSCRCHNVPTEPEKCEHGETKQHPIAGLYEPGKPRHHGFAEVECPGPAVSAPTVSEETVTDLDVIAAVKEYSRAYFKERPLNGFQLEIVDQLVEDGAHREAMKATLEAALARRKTAEPDPAKCSHKGATVVACVWCQTILQRYSGEPSHELRELRALTKKWRRDTQYHGTPMHVAVLRLANELDAVLDALKGGTR